MNEAQLAPLAEKLIRAYQETAIASRQFRDDYQAPLTVMAKAHTMRSIAQALIASDDRYDLHAEYAEFGRVQWTDLRHGRTYRLRSHSASTIENWAKQETFFDSNPFIRSAVTLLIYSFSPAGLTLAVAGSKGKPDSSRLFLSGRAVPVGCWPYDAALEAGTFDQAADDPFTELGELNDEEEDGGDK